MSTETNDHVISVLNDLIETCKDGEQGFRTAAEALGETELRTLFNMYAQQRARFAAELNNEVLRHGGEPAKSGHVTAAFHRGWINIKQAVTGKSEAAVIDECERGEDAAKHNYEHALKEHLPADLMSMVEMQYAEILDAHDRVRAMKQAVHAAK